MAQAIGSDQVVRLDRRRLLRGVAGLGTASALTLLAGCTPEAVEAIAGTCPDDPDDPTNVDWTPDVGHPVFWGFQDLGPADGAPREMRVFYPTYEGFTDRPPILKVCLNQWPVVLFLHGQPPTGIPFAGYHRRWDQFGAALARCGHVVVVPNHAAGLPQDSSDPQIQAALDDVDWVRTDWEHAGSVIQQPESTAVVGHSYGALLAARVAAARPQIGALVSLSGGFHELSGPLTVLQGAGPPALFMWAQGDGLGLVFEDLDSGGLWDRLAGPKYAVVYQGEHFDYLREGGDLRGPCSLVGAVAAELATLFISAQVPKPLSRTRVPVDLRPPQVNLSDRQRFFAGGHLNGLAQFAEREDCQAQLRWFVDGAAGSRQL